jgi:uncharacterized protein (TIGR01244 family)
MKYVIALFFVLIGFAFTFADENLPNLQQPSYKVYTAGQPTEAGFKQAAEMGIKTVINVLPEKECVADEEHMVTSNKMAYHALPFSTTDFKMAMIRDFAVLIKSVDKPVLVHCSTGNHVGGLWFAYRVLMEKAPLPIALIEGRQIGMKPELEDALFTWVIGQQQSGSMDQAVGK